MCLGFHDKYGEDEKDSRIGGAEARTREEFLIQLEDLAAILKIQMQNDQS